MSNNIFSFINENEVSQKEEKIKEKNVFEYIKDIYKIIKDKPDNLDKEIDELFHNLPENEYFFVSWALNHYLLYNEFTRKNLDMFITTNYWLKPKEYITWYIKFMSSNNAKFPNWMYWYKLNIDDSDKKYLDILKNEYNLSEEEINDMVDYMRNDISLREICLNLEYINIKE